MNTRVRCAHECGAQTSALRQLPMSALRKQVRCAHDCVANTSGLRTRVAYAQEWPKHTSSLRDAHDWPMQLYTSTVALSDVARGVGRRPTVAYAAE